MKLGVTGACQKSLLYEAIDAAWWKKLQQRRQPSEPVSKTTL